MNRYRLSICSDTGYIKVIKVIFITHGRFLRCLSDPVESFQGIVTDVMTCHNISNWEAKAPIVNFAKLRRISHVSFLSYRDSFPCEQYRRCSSGGCERTPCPIRRYRNKSYDMSTMSWYAMYIE